MIPPDETIAVIMCAWKRPENFQGTLRDLSAQCDKNFRFFVWNNNPEISGFLEGQALGGGIPVEIKNSPTNIGEIGLLHFGRDLRGRGFRYAITIDDDEAIPPCAVWSFRAEAATKTISSFWGWRFIPGKNYYDRFRPNPGEPVHYCGFGGTVFDADVFLNDRIFSPDSPVWRVGDRVVLTDLWVSYVASMSGWSLRRSRVLLEIGVDGKDQSIGLCERKNWALSDLRDRGWTA